LRILHVIRGLANSSGTTHIVGPLAEAQARQSHSVKVLFVEKTKEPAIVPNPSLVESQGFPMSVPSERGWSRPFARAFSSAVRNTDIVHVHAIWNFPTWYAMREAHRAGVPYVVAPQGSLEEWALNRGRRLKAVYASVAEKPYFDRAAAMQALTAAEASQCRRFGIKAPVMILPNGVDLSSVDHKTEKADLRAELSLPSNAVLFLFLGRVFPKKGLDLLIPAFARLAAARKDTFLVIAGDDGGNGYRASMERLAQSLGIKRRVHFLGEVCGDRKFAVLRGADAFVLSSYSEGLPVAVLEAMACRCPVIVTPNCNLSEVKDRKAGWLVEPNVDSVLTGLNEASRSAEERQRRGENARSLVEEHFTWDRIASESIRFYLQHRLRTN
jgi:glycosyltransferase involved in cell wall biosynthesis